MPSTRAASLDPFARLSPAERASLGTRRPSRREGVLGPQIVPPDLWPQVRAAILTRSRAAAARGRPDEVLAERMTAFTPGETLQLLGEPEVRAWHAAMAHYRLPTHDASGRPITTVLFVPCAKTKPWDTAKAGLYGAYNRLRAEIAAGTLPATTLVTLSEPLGIVPEAHWGDFPSYDNPGLFRDDVLRSGGLFTRDWAQLTPTGARYVLPFDEAAWQQAIARLGGVIGKFLLANQDRWASLRWISAVADPAPQVSTHTAMLQAALATVGGPAIEAVLKKSAPRVAPDGHLAAVLRRPPTVAGPAAQGAARGSGRPKTEAARRR